MKHLAASRASTLSLSLSVALSFVTLISFFILSSSSIFASDHVSNVSVTVPVSCNITSTLDTAHTATINPGQVKADIGTTTFKVFCNDNTGYAIYAIGYSGDEYGNTNMLPTNPATSTNPSIVTGTATSGNTSNWAMKVTPVAGTYAPTIENGFNSYRTVPDTYTKVATLTTNTDFTIGSSFQSTYRVFVSQAQPADTYTGKVKYTIVHPNDADPPTQPQAAEPKCISYWPNASSVVDSMANDCNSGPTGSGYGNRADATLWATNFRRDGYGFAGWSDKFDWVLNENDADGNGTGANADYHIYGPNATITTPPDMTEKGLSLYAVWAKSRGNLQGWNGCSGLSIGNVTALTDQRDGNTYAVAKLADGKCWMIENLRLDNEYTVGAENEAKAQDYAKSTTYGDFIGLAEPETANFTNSTTANSTYYSGTQSGTASVNIGTNNYPSYRFPRFNNQNTASPATNMTNNGGNTYSYGNWYTWPAAVADTGYYTSGSVTTTSICPKGWHLPTGTSSGEYYTLHTALGGDGGANGSKALRGFPNNFIYSGGFYDSSVGSRGSYGTYWSSSVGRVNRGYCLNFYWGGVGDTASGDKYNGYSVRCLVGS